jgi:glycosyltransferase involved in cell wall biosynthesis
MRTLYICYFGLREPLVQTQVLPYLRELSQAGVGVHLLTFEPAARERWGEEDRHEWRARLASQGIRWRALAYHKRPSLPATLYDIVVGALTAAMWSRREQIDVLHARAHIPLAIGLLARLFIRAKLIFDIRGLIADEYVDAEIWRKGSFAYRAIKRLESAGVKYSDRIVVLTEKMRDWLISNRLAERDKIEVIPCCIDISRFGEANPESKRSEHFELIYAGAVTGLYMLEEMGRFFISLRSRIPNAFFRILTTSPVAGATATLKRVGLREEEFWIGAVKPEEVPGYLRQAHLGISFRKPSFSQIAASPTKIPEYLAAGLPVISNAGIGDMDSLFDAEEVGVIVQETDDQSLSRSVTQILELMNAQSVFERCRKTAIQHFDLKRIGGERYLRVYEQLNRATRH